MEGKREKRIEYDCQVSALGVGEQMGVPTCACVEKNIFDGRIMSSFLQCLIWACNWKHEPEAWGVVWAGDTDWRVIRNYSGSIYRV